MTMGSNVEPNHLEYLNNLIFFLIMKLTYPK